MSSLSAQTSDRLAVLILWGMGVGLALGVILIAVVLTLNAGAYISEIFRAGILSIHLGQTQAAYSLGLSRFDTYRDVILPQAIRRILPPLTGEVISLIKNTSLVGLVSLSDLALQARVIAADTFLTFEVWFATAAIYLAVTVPLSLIVYAMEKRFKILT